MDRGERFADRARQLAPLGKVHSWDISEARLAADEQVDSN
jgi:hypothetical protein